ncbi:MAG: MarR family transcriptional regulator [Lachnospiraceae bacterium]|nr:MarR family transcriptional regulator [Lachnospiraceae bacterium]
MLPLNPWEHQNAIKALYSKCVEGVCVKHNITRMELDILLFLANNPCFDTASDIIEIRYLSKSQVSSSIKLLEQRGYLRKEYLENNRKTAHLWICKTAMEIIHDGQDAQEEFISIMLDGFSQEEIGRMKQYNDRILRNISACLKGKEVE